MNLKIYPRKNENINQCLRRFRKILDKEGITKDIKRRAFYEKPSDANRRIKRKTQRDKAKELRQKQNKSPRTNEQTNLNREIRS